MNIRIPEVAIVENVVRSTAVYRFLLVAYRVVGKRPLGQLTALDLVVFLIAAMIQVRSAIREEDGRRVGVMPWSVLPA